MKDIVIRKLEQAIEDRDLEFAKNLLDFYSYLFTDKELLYAREVLEAENDKQV